MRFAFFFMAEYTNMVLVSCVAAVLFFGGWQAPYPGTLLPENLAWIEGIFWFTVKVFFFLFMFFWLRATLPRLRYDQLMRFGWKVMLPLALANVVLTAIGEQINQITSPLYGADAYLDKPFDFDELERIIDELLAKRS